MRVGAIAIGIDLETPGDAVRLKGLTVNRFLGVPMLAEMPQLVSGRGVFRHQI